MKTDGNKKELSLKRQYQQLTQARARAARAGQPTPKLDAKIEEIRAMMGSTIQRKPTLRPSPSAYTGYKGVSKSPMQGGSFSPR